MPNYIEKDGIKFTFCHIPRTAGGSIASALDIKSVGHSVQIPAKDKFIFCFVRNPFDRVVSIYYYLKQGGKNDKDKADAQKYVKDYSFSQFVKKSLARGSEEQIHMRPQTYWIPKGADFIGYYENLDFYYKYLVNMIGIKYKELPHFHSSAHQPFRVYYNDELLNLVYDIYSQDFRLFPKKR